MTFKHFLKASLVSLSFVSFFAVQSAFAAIPPTQTLSITRATGNSAEKNLSNLTLADDKLTFVFNSTQDTSLYYRIKIVAKIGTSESEVGTYNVGQIYSSTVGLNSDLGLLPGTYGFSIMACTDSTAASPALYSNCNTGWSNEVLVTLLRNTVNITTVQAELKVNGISGSSINLTPATSVYGALPSIKPDTVTFSFNTVPTLNGSMDVNYNLELNGTSWKLGTTTNTWIGGVSSDLGLAPGTVNSFKVKACDASIGNGYDRCSQWSALTTITITACVTHSSFDPATKSCSVAPSAQARPTLSINGNAVTGNNTTVSATSPVTMSNTGASTCYVDTIAVANSVGVAPVTRTFTLGTKHSYTCVGTDAADPSQVSFVIVDEAYQTAAPRSLNLYITKSSEPSLISNTNLTIPSDSTFTMSMQIDSSENNISRSYPYFYYYKSNSSAWIRVPEGYGYITPSGVSFGGVTPAAVGANVGKYSLVARVCKGMANSSVNASNCTESNAATMEVTAGAIAQIPEATDLQISSSTVALTGTFNVSMQSNNSPTYYEYQVNGGAFYRVPADIYNTASGAYMGNSNGKTPAELGLSAGQTYRVGARSCNVAGCGPITTKTLTVNAPATPVTPSSLSLTVTPSVAADKLFRIAMAINPAETSLSVPAYYYRYRINSGAWSNKVTTNISTFGVDFTGSSPSAYGLTPGTYRIQGRVCNGSESLCKDSSEQTMEVKDPATAAAAPPTAVEPSSLTLSVPATVNKDTSFALVMGVTPQDTIPFKYTYTYTINGVSRSVPTYYVSAGGTGVNFNGFTPTQLGMNPGIYKITAKVCNGTLCKDSSEQTMEVKDPATAAPAPAPAASISLNMAGSVLSWTATNASTCEYNTGGSSWYSASPLPTGSLSVAGLIPTNTTITARCKSSSGVTGSPTSVVYIAPTAVTPPAPAVTSLTINVNGTAYEGGSMLTSTSPLTFSGWTGSKCVAGGVHASPATFAVGSMQQIMCYTIANSSEVKAVYVTVAAVLGASASCVDLPRNMHRGAESASVKTLQNFLIEKGFMTEAASGFYGDYTVSAVKDYQASMNLPVTGMVYDFTRVAIKEDSCD